MSDHEWADITRMCDHDLHYACLNCGATKTEPRDTCADPEETP